MKKKIPVLLVFLFAIVVMVSEAIKPLRWGDEIIAIKFAENHTYMQLLVDLQGNKLPPYYILLKAWEDLTPWGYLSARVLSLFAVLLTIAIVYKIGLHYGDRRFAIAAVIVTGLSSALLDMGAWIRPYAFLLALFVIGWYGLLRVREGHKRGWVIYLPATALMLITHHFGMMAVIAQIPALWSVRRSMNPYAVAGIVTPTVIAGLVIVLELLNGGAPINHLEGPPTVAHIAYFLPALLSGAVTDRLITVGGAGLVIGICWIVATKGVDKRVLELGSMIVLPTLAIVAFSYSIQPLFQMKYLSFLIPVAALFTVSVAARGSPWQRRALIMFLITIQTVGISELLRGAPRAHWVFSLW